MEGYWLTTRRMVGVLLRPPHTPCRGYHPADFGRVWLLPFHGDGTHRISCFPTRRRIVKDRNECHTLQPRSTHVNVQAYRGDDSFAGTTADLARHLATMSSMAAEARQSLFGLTQVIAAYLVRSTADCHSVLVLLALYNLHSIQLLRPYVMRVVGRESPGLVLRDSMEVCLNAAAEIIDLCRYMRDYHGMQASPLNLQQ